MSGIRVDDLAAGYGSLAVLAGTSLAVASGSLTCVLGASGCGKTTLLRVIAGFEPARAGSVRIGDRVVDDAKSRVPAEKRRVGYVPQEGSLFPHLTVADNVGFSMGRRSRDARAARRARIAELLALVGMGELAARYPHQLSGGQQQRVAVARALASSPEVILLDEPFAALDAALRAQLRSDIRSVLRTAGVTALLVTHDRAEALSLGDEIAVMRDGYIAQVAPPHELYTRPADADVARFVADATTLDATTDAATAHTPLGPLPIDPASTVRPGACRVVIRPEQVRLMPVTARDGGDAIGKVTHAEYFGHDARLDVTLTTSNGDVHVAARIPGPDAPSEGSHVAVTVDSPVWLLQP